MSFEYLQQKRWKDISRDERRFCADLVFQLEYNNTQRNFIDWIIKQNKLNIAEYDNFEIDFEVCFYRDFIFDHELKHKANFSGKSAIKGLLKRTFDICIFLPNDIIIIEAKAAKGMTSSQMIEFKYDKLAIEACIQYFKLPKTNVYIIGLISSEYKTDTIKKLNEQFNYFDGIINWQEIENEKELKYNQPQKLKTVFSETNKKRKPTTQHNKLIDQLTILTQNMELEINTTRRNKSNESL